MERSTKFCQRARGTRRLKPPSLSMLHPSTFTMITPKWNKSKSFYISSVNKTFPPLLLIHIICIRTLMNAVSRFIIRAKRSSSTILAILSVCEFMTYCFGLVFLTAWLKLHMGFGVIVNFHLASPPP